MLPQLCDKPIRELLCISHLLAHSATGVVVSITATGKATECYTSQGRELECHHVTCTSLTGSESSDGSDLLKVMWLAGKSRHLSAICFLGEARTSGKGAYREQSGRQGGCTGQAARGRRAAGPEGSKAGLGSLVPQRNLRGGWQLHALQPS